MSARYWAYIIMLFVGCGLAAWALYGRFAREPLPVQPEFSSIPFEQTKTLAPGEKAASSPTSSAPEVLTLNAEEWIRVLHSTDPKENLFPKNFGGDEIPVVAGHTRSKIPGLTAGFFWQPEFDKAQSTSDAFQRVESFLVEGAHSADDVSPDGRFVLVDMVGRAPYRIFDREDPAWVFDLPQVHQFRPDLLTRQAEQVIGKSVGDDGLHYLTRFTPETNQMDWLTVPLKQSNLLVVRDCDDRGKVVVGNALTTRDGEKGHLPWCWTEVHDLLDIPDELQDVLNVELIDVNTNGSKILGYHPERGAFFASVRGSQLIVDQYFEVEGTPSSMNDDASLVVGSQRQGGWIRFVNEQRTELVNSVLQRGFMKNDLRLSRLRWVSPDSRYFIGHAHSSTGTATHVLVIEADKLLPHFQKTAN